MEIARPWATTTRNGAAAPPSVAGGTVGGRAFHDGGGDGAAVHDIGNGAGGINVWLFSCEPHAPLAHSVTASSGIYRFTDLPPGEYYVTAQPLAGHEFSASGSAGGGETGTVSTIDPESGRTACFELGEGEKTMDWSFGLHRPTDAPSVRPSPTVGPTAGPSPGPSLRPTGILTSGPSLRSSPGPSALPPQKLTIGPSPRPSLRLTMVPGSDPPTDAGNGGASDLPSVNPSLISTMRAPATGGSNAPSPESTNPSATGSAGTIYPWDGMNEADGIRDNVNDVRDSADLNSADSRIEGGGGGKDLFGTAIAVASGALALLGVAAAAAVLALRRKRKRRGNGGRMKRGRFGGDHAGGDDATPCDVDGPRRNERDERSPTQPPSLFCSDDCSRDHGRKQVCLQFPTRSTSNGRGVPPMEGPPPPLVFTPLHSSMPDARSLAAPPPAASVAKEKIQGCDIDALVREHHSKRGGCDIDEFVRELRSLSVLIRSYPKDSPHGKMLHSNLELARAELNAIAQRGVTTSLEINAQADSGSSESCPSTEPASGHGDGTKGEEWISPLGELSISPDASHVRRALSVALIPSPASYGDDAFDTEVNSIESIEMGFRNLSTAVRSVVERAREELDGIRRDDKDRFRVIHVTAPPGKNLGLIVDGPPGGGGPAHVHSLHVFSPLQGRVWPNDMIVAIDGEDVTRLEPVEVGKRLGRNRKRAKRTISIMRDCCDDGAATCNLDRAAFAPTSNTGAGKLRLIDRESGVASFARPEENSQSRQESISDHALRSKTAGATLIAQTSTKSVELCCLRGSESRTMPTARLEEESKFVPETVKDSSLAFVSLSEMDSVTTISHKSTQTKEGYIGRIIVPPLQAFDSIIHQPPPKSYISVSVTDSSTSIDSICAKTESNQVYERSESTQMILVKAEDSPADFLPPRSDSGSESVRYYNTTLDDFVKVEPDAALALAPAITLSMHSATQTELSGLLQIKDRRIEMRRDEVEEEIAQLASYESKNAMEIQAETTPMESCDGVLEKETSSAVRTESETAPSPENIAQTAFSSNGIR